MGIFSRKSEKKIENQEERAYHAYGLSFSTLASFNKSEALKVSTFYGCVNLISNAIAELPVTIYKWDGNRKIKITGNDIWKLLNLKADTKFNHFALFKTAIESVIMKGNAYIEVLRDEQLNLKGLQFIDADFVQPMIQPDGKVKYSVVGRQSLIEDYNLINLYLHVDNTYRGISLLTYAYNTLQENYSTQNYAGNVYNKSAAGIIKSRNRLNKEQTQEIYNAWQNAFNNNNSVGVAVINEGLDFQQLQISARDADLLASRAFAAEDICRFFGIPSSMLNYNEHQSYNSLESDRLNFLQNAVLPFVRMLETELNLKVFKPSQIGKTFIELDVTELMRVDKTSEATFYKSLLDAGVMSINEIREKFNLEPIPDEAGNALWKQISYGTVEQIASGVYIKQTPQEQNQKTDNNLGKNDKENEEAE